MALRLTPTDSVSRRNADLLRNGYDFAASQGLAPNLFLTVRWGETSFSDRPFLGLQKLLEKLRKLDRTGPCVFLWCRERECPVAIEHAHILILLRAIKRAALNDLVVQWVGATNDYSAIDVRYCKTLPWCNAETLAKLYFLKGIRADLRSEYRIRGAKPQGIIVGKRVGVSQYISKGLRTSSGIK